MNSRSKISEYERATLVGLFEVGIGYVAAARRVGCGVKSARNLWDRWRIHGKLCLVRKPHNMQYPFELKREAVERFLAGESKPDIAKALGMSGPKVIDRWVRTYHEKGLDGLRPQPKGRPKGAKSTTRTVVSEAEQLRRRVEYLEAENAYLKKLQDLRSQKRA